MFESDIERSKIRLLELVNTTQSYVYLNDILGRGSIDYAYKQYFEAEFGWWLYEEQTLRQANPNLDQSDASTVSILNNLDAQYRKNARFDREQLMLIIDSAVKSVLNYRVRPRTTLKWFVYRGEPTKPVYEVYLRMRYFADYRYLHEGFNQWLLKRGLRYDSLDIISVLEFERLIKKIDDDTILELSPSQFVELLSPISYFFTDIAADPTKQTIPIEAAIIFLDDKEVYIIAQKLERMLYQQGVRLLTKEMFLSVVDEVLSEVENVQPSNEALSTSSDADEIIRIGEEHGIEESRNPTFVETKPTIGTHKKFAAKKVIEEALLSARSVETSVETSVLHGDDIESVRRIVVTASEERDEEDATELDHIAAESKIVHDEAEVSASSFDPTADRTPPPSSFTSVIEALSLSAQQTHHNELLRSSFALNNEQRVEANSLSARVADQADASLLSSQEDAPSVSSVETGSLSESAANNDSSFVAERPDSPLHSLFFKNAGESEESYSHDAHIQGSELAATESTFPEQELPQQAQTVAEDIKHSIASNLNIEEQDGPQNSINDRTVNGDMSSSRTQRASELLVEGDNSPQATHEQNTSPEILGIISRALQNENAASESRVPSTRSQYFENATTSSADEKLETLRAKVYPSLKSFYDDRQRDTYIKKLCNRDSERFEQLVLSIDATTNWKDALAFLDKFYSQESIDPQSSVARDFRMAVYKRFIAL